MRPWSRTSPPPRKPPDELSELRRLISRPEQEKLRALRERLDDKEVRAHEIASVLPEAITLTDRPEDLSRALRPAVEGSVRASVEKRPQFLIDALHPLIGSIVRRSIAESFRTLLQSLNQTLERSFSWQGLKWRFEALRTGKSFSEVVMLRSLVYRVEEIFLIHRETGLSLLHLTGETSAQQDPEMIAAMSSAIQDFARDSFKTGKDEGLDEFRIGELEVWIAPGRYAYLAAAIRGTPPRELRTCLEEAIESIHILRASDLRNFDGDSSPFDSLRPELEPCLRAQYHAKKTSAGHRRAWLALAAGTGLIVAGLIVGIEKQRRWNDFVRRLNASPGVAVTQANKHWFTRSRIAGLRDPAIADPAAIARAAGVNPDKLRFEWKDYMALDDASLLRRFTKRFGKPAGANISLTNGMLALSGQAPYEWLQYVRNEGRQVPGITSIQENNLGVIYDPTLALERFRAQFPPPAGVTATVRDGTLKLSGTAPWEWVETVRAGATRLPGISRLSETDLKIAYDARLVLQRFVSRFNLPDSVNASVTDGTLVLAGEAPHAWLTRVRRGAPGVPGINKIDEHNLTDLDQQTFQQSKSVIESAFVYFLTNKDKFATEGFAALSRLPDEIRRCTNAANRLGIGIQIEVQGNADPVGDEVKNRDLSQRRADAVKDFLVKCGFEPGVFNAIGMGAPPPPARGQPHADEADRRVAFKVVPKS